MAELSEKISNVVCRFVQGVYLNWLQINEANISKLSK